MTCDKCGHTVKETDLFCPHCGVELGLTALDALTVKIKQLRRYSDLDTAYLIYKVYSEGLYLSKYTDFPEYGEREFGFKPATIYLYKEVGEKFLDRYGNPVIPDAHFWSIGRLSELRSMPIHLIRQLMEQRILTPLMPTKEIRAIKKECKANKWRYLPDVIK